MKMVHLPCVPDVLDTNQNAERVTLLHGIPSVFQSVRPLGFLSVITGDEPRFVLYDPCDWTWAPSQDEVSERVSEKIAQKNVQFHSFGLSTQTIALLTFRKVAHIIQDSFARLANQACLTSDFTFPKKTT
jgi:hypothetical protein